MEEISGLPLILQSLLVDFVTFLPKLIAALAIFLVGLYLVALATRLVRKGLERRRVKAEAIQALTQVTRWSLIALVAVTALQQVEFDLTAFVAGLGIIGFTIGFALQDISENFVAGLMLLLQRPFDLGDVVQIEEFRGRVTDVSLRATEIETLDGHNVVLPNGMVYNNPILNFTRRPLARVALDVGVSYDSDLDEVRRVALEAIATVPEALSDPAPYVVFHTFADSSINLTLFYWIDSRETAQFRASDLAVPMVKKAFDQAAIDIPYPVRNVYVQQQPTQVPA